MTIEPAIQANFERNIIWERSWPRCILAIIAIVELMLGLVILVSEICNILTDFWHTNVFGGIWASIILFVNWILIFVTVCCLPTVRASTCSFIWHFITLIALALLIAFDIVFIVNPYTCILTSSCSTQSSSFSLNTYLQTVSQFQYYSIYDSKKLFLEVQVGCAGLAFLLTIVYIIVFLVCRLKLRKRTIQDNPAAIIPAPKRGLRIAQAPIVPYTHLSNMNPYTPY